MTTLVERIVDVCEHLDRAGLPWALGGALALAYATEEPRATRDIDVNVFVPATEAARVFAALQSFARDGKVAQTSPLAWYRPPRRSRVGPWRAPSGRGGSPVR